MMSVAEVFNFGVSWFKIDVYSSPRNENSFCVLANLRYHSK